MANITNKSVIISFFVTSLSFASTAIIADVEETEPEEVIILGIPCQPFPECIVDSLKIGPDSRLYGPTNTRLKDESITQLNKESEKEQSTK